MREQVIDPRIDRALELTTQLGGVRDQLATARRAACGFQQFDALAGQHLPLTGGDLGDPVAQVIIGLERYSLSVFLDRIEFGKLVRLAKLGVLILSQRDG